MPSVKRRPSTSTRDLITLLDSALCALAKARSRKQQMVCTLPFTKRRRSPAHSCYMMALTSKLNGFTGTDGLRTLCSAAATSKHDSSTAARPCVFGSDYACIAAWRALSRAAVAALLQRFNQTSAVMEPTRRLFRAPDAHVPARLHSPFHIAPGCLTRDESRAAAQR